MNTNTLNDRIIIRASTSSPTTSLVSVRRHLPLSRHPVASRETIRRWLADADLRNRRPLSHLPLICYHRQYPLDFFRPRASWNMTDWRCCLQHDWCYAFISCPQTLIYFVPYTWQCMNPGAAHCVHGPRVRGDPTMDTVHRRVRSTDRDARTLSEGRIGRRHVSSVPKRKRGSEEELQRTNTGKWTEESRLDEHKIA
ncbi:HTH_Tnp_Tc3_2 domain-containing protein [Trichonephila clavipes]|nr:HTH_Tnp_Tc3_2 domain-containing protein [Trichonephila clavipes]